MLTLNTLAYIIILMSFFLDLTIMLLMVEIDSVLISGVRNRFRVKFAWSSSCHRNKNVDSIGSS